jgi:enamine deaminase RidA (YjgF/YER057c/UK114 family)
MIQVKEETASVEDECGGTVTVPRSSETGFTDIHLAANGATERFVLAFADKGKHARTSIAMAELPLNVPFEVEVTAVLA